MTIDIKDKKTVGIIVGVVAGLLLNNVLIYSFSSKYKLEFRTPLIIQSPVLVHERVIDSYIEIKEPVLFEVKEDTTDQLDEVVKPVEVQEVSFSPSSRLIKHTEQRPEVYAKIVEWFGSESMKYGELISRESSLNPQAINPTSKACGLAQALPCSKLKCSLDDVDCQLDWISEYVSRRYGNIDNALAFHDSNNWY